MVYYIVNLEKKLTDHRKDADYSLLSSGLGDAAIIDLSSLIHYFSADFLFSSELSGFLVYIARESCNYNPRLGIFSHCHSINDSCDTEDKTGLLETLTIERKESKAACASDVLTLVCWSHSPKSGLIIDNNPDITRLLYCLPVTSRARANICTFGIYWLDQTSATRASHKDVDNED